MFKNQLSKTTTGIIFMAIGLVLFLYTTGIIAETLRPIIIVFSLCLIGYGFIESHAYVLIQKFINKKDSKKKDE